MRTGRPGVCQHRSAQLLSGALPQPAWRPSTSVHPSEGQPSVDQPSADRRHFPLASLAEAEEARCRGAVAVAVVGLRRLVVAAAAAAERHPHSLAEWALLQQPFWRQLPFWRRLQRALQPTRFPSSAVPRHSSASGLRQGGYARADRLLRLGLDGPPPPPEPCGAQPESTGVPGSGWIAFSGRRHQGVPC